jgi:hypothetical protein
LYVSALKIVMHEDADIPLSWCSLIIWLKFISKRFDRTYEIQDVHTLKKEKMTRHMKDYWHRWFAASDAFR